MSLTALVLLICFLGLPAWGEQYYLYESKPVTAGEKGQAKDGVLVTEVPVQKGDTLYDISKKFSGRGMYYPQILLFNNIKDPNLIYPGNTLKVPVTQNGVAQTKEATGKSKKLKSRDETEKPKGTSQLSPVSTPRVAPVTEISLSELRALDEAKPNKRGNKKRVASHVRAKDKKEKVIAAGKADSVPAPVINNETTGQKLFERALKAYRQDEFSAALELFDRYLADNSNSPLAADASLYKAECYLKLSSQ